MEIHKYDGANNGDYYQKPFVICAKDSDDGLIFTNSDSFVTCQECQRLIKNRRKTIERMCRGAEKHLSQKAN